MPILDDKEFGVESPKAVLSDEEFLGAPAEARPNYFERTQPEPPVSYTDIAKQADIFPNQNPLGKFLQRGVSGIGAVLKGEAMLGTGRGRPVYNKELGTFGEETPAGRLARLTQKPEFVAGQALQDVAPEVHPVTPEQEKGILTKVGGEAGSFVPLVATGPLAPATIALQTAGEHISADYENAKGEGKSDEEAAQTAMDKAVVSGGIQGAIFAILPAPLRKLGDKYLIDKFGSTVVKKFLAARAAQFGEGAVLGATSGGAEGAVEGKSLKDIAGDVTTSGAAMGAIQTVFPRGPTGREVANQNYFDRRRIASEQEFVGKLAGKGMPTFRGEVPEGTAPVPIEGNPYNLGEIPPGGTVPASRGRIRLTLNRDESRGTPWPTLPGPTHPPEGVPSKYMPKRFGEPGYRFTDAEANDDYVENGGWKLHITVAPENYASVDKWLWENHKGQYKLLAGGDHSDGKDFTIYAGSKDAANAFAGKIESEIPGLIEPSAAVKTTAVSEDVLLTPKVAARFDTRAKANAGDPHEFYGRNGIPFDSDAKHVELEMIRAKRNNAPPEVIGEIESRLKLHQRIIEKRLATRYGERFTGKQSTTGEPNAIQKRSTTAAHVDETPKDSAEVGAGESGPPAIAVSRSEEAQGAAASDQAVTPESLVEGTPIQEVALAQLTLSKDVPQFKRGANEKGVVQPIGGTFDRRGVAPIQVWRRTNGRLEVISGRHRLDLAQRSGEKTVPVQIHDEAKGFDAQAAASLDAELNIRDEQGSVGDYANYFKHSKVSEDEANARGLLARPKGQAGFSIAQNASDDLFALHQAERITDAQAAAIANVAPQDAALQAVGIKAALDGKSAETSADLITLAKGRVAARKAQGQQSDLFGFDDTAIREMEAQAKLAADERKGLREQIGAVKGAAKKPEVAKSLGVNVENPEGVQAKVSELEARLEQLKNHPELAERKSELEFAKPESVEEQNARLAKEAEVAKTKADKERLAKEAAKPLVGTAGDLGQGDLLKSPEDLFAPPAPKVVEEGTLSSEQARAVEAAQKYRIKNAGPQTYSLVERLKQSEAEKQNGEQFVKVKNDKTGKGETLLETDIEPVRTRTPEERAASKGITKREMDDMLLKAGMEPGEFPDMASKRAALRRWKGKGGKFSLAQAFYSRITRAVEESKQGKATGAQWKATIRNSKAGVNKDEWALVSVDDLEDGKPYTKQEVLNYLRANEVKVKDVTLGNNSKAVAMVRFDDLDKEVQRTLPGHLMMNRNDWVATVDGEFAGTAEGHYSKQDALRIINEDRGGAEMGEAGAETHFSQYTIPGAKEGSYREVLLTVPAKRVDTSKWTAENVGEASSGNPRYRTWRIRDEENRHLGHVDAGTAADAIALRVGQDQSGQWRDGHSQYSDVPNPIVRLRLNERTTADGKRMLFLEEVQAPQKGNFEKMPALFQKQWREIAFKWALRYAAEKGFDSVGWTTGEQQSARYDLSKKVQGITWNRSPREDSYDLHFLPHGYGPESAFDYDKLSLIHRAIPAGQLEDYVGKDLAKKIQEAEGNAIEFKGIDTGQRRGYITGEDLRVGGTGLRKLYDQDFRNVVNNLPVVKRAGQKVGMGHIPIKETAVKSHPFAVRDARGRDYGSVFKTRESAQEVASRIGGTVYSSTEANQEPVHSLNITPDMRESVMSGQAQFHMGDVVEPTKRVGYSDAAAEVSAAQKRNKKLPPVDIVDRPDWTNQGEDGNQYGIKGLWRDGKIILNRAFLRDAADVRETIEHEATHPILESGEGQKAIEEALKLGLGGSDLYELMKRYGGDKRLAQEEWFANLAQKDLPLWQRIVGRVREFLAKAGIVKLTDEEIGRAMLRALRNKSSDPLTAEQAQAKASLAKTPVEYQKQRELDPQTRPATRVVGAYADIVRMKLEHAERLGLSPRARAMLNLPTQSELAARGLAAAGGIENYYEARDSVPKTNPNLRWGVIGDALEAHGRDQARGIKFEKIYAEQRALVDSPGFQKKLQRSLNREMLATLAKQKEETFRNIMAVKAAEYVEQLGKAKADDARSMELRQDLAQTRQLLNHSMAVAQQMDNIVSRVYRNYWQFGRDSKSGKAFTELYLSVRSGEGNPVTNSQELALVRLAAEVLAINSNLTEKLVWMERMRVEPDFAKAVDDFGKTFAARLEKEPALAIKQLVSREGKLASKTADAQRAFVAINKEVMRELEKYSDLEGVVSAQRAIEGSTQWRQLINTVYSDAQALRIPKVVLDNMKNGQVFNEFTGRIAKIDPQGVIHEIDLNWTRERAAAAQREIHGYLSSIRDWLEQPENRNHPDAKYWQEQADFVDAVYNTASVLNPGSVKSLVFKHSWSMPEFFFRQAALPAAKVTQTAFENWHRAWAIGDQWSRATEQPLIRKLSQAAKRHGFDVSLGLQEYREKVLNPLAWEYRHGRAIHAGDVLLGVKIYPEDIAALKSMGTAINELLRKQKNLGAERVMEKERLYDEWAPGVFSIRRPQEFGAEPGTTVPREFSLAAKTLATRIAELGDKYQEIMQTLDRQQYFEPFVMRWLGQRSADYAKVTPFEPLFKEILNKWNAHAEDAPRTMDEIIDFIHENTDDTYSRDDVVRIVAGGMAEELTSFYTRFVKRATNDFADIRVVRATKDGPFTQGFQRDVGSSFYYDFGIANAQEVRSMAIDAGMYHMMRFANSLSSLEKEYARALLDLEETKGNPAARWKLLAENRKLYRSGDDFRDFNQLQEQLNEVNYFRSKLPIFSGQDVATYESLRNLYRLIGDAVSMKLSGWKTLTRVLTGSVVKQGFVFGAVDRFYAMSYAKAAVSMAMSTFNIAGVGPLKMVGRRLGLVKEFDTALSGLAEELFRSSKYFDQQYAYGLGSKTPVLDTVLNNLTQPYTHGRGYDPRLSENKLLRGVQKGGYRFLSAVEAPLEVIRTLFPGLGYAIAYDSVARQSHWMVKTLEAQARRSFYTHEKLGTLDRFDLVNPKSTGNMLPPAQVLPRGLFPSTQTEYNLVREMFKRGTDTDLNDAVMQFWKRLSETPANERDKVHLLSADAKTPEDVTRLEKDRAGALATIGLLDIHHASPANRMWALRSGSAGRLVFPIMGWFAQSTRQIFALLGRAPHDPELSPAMLTAMTAVTVLAALGISTLFGDAEKRVFEKLTWLLEKRVDPVRHLGQGRNLKEEAQIAASDATAYITILNSIFNSILGEKSNRGQMGAQVFVTEEINSWLNYINGVVHTKNLAYGLPQLAAREFPLSKIVINRMPSQQGIVEEGNARTIIQRFAPPELLRQTGGSVGMPTPTELSPIKMKLANAIYRGDSVGVAEAYDEFKRRAAELGRPDPDRLAAAVMRSLNPYSIALVGHPTEAQRADMLSKLPQNERDMLQTAERNFMAATQSVGVNATLLKDEDRGTGGAGAGSSTGNASTSAATGAFGSSGRSGLPPTRSLRGPGVAFGGRTGLGRGQTRSRGRLSLRGRSGGRGRLVSGRLRSRVGGLRRSGRLSRIRLSRGGSHHKQTA